jgi:uncharacterized tellurite resistance protein B-like protein
LTGALVGAMIAHMMQEEEFAIVKSLVPVAWADGVYAEKEKEMLEALLEAYRASETQKEAIREYAKEKKTIDDINLQDLSAADRRVLLQQAVLLTFVDGEQAPEEDAFLKQLGAKLRIPDDEAKQVMTEAADRAKKLLNLL